MHSKVLVRTMYALYRSCILLALATALFSEHAWQQTQLATVFGTITDPSGAVVPGVKVTIANQGTGLNPSALTDVPGQYRFAGLPTGNYSVRVEKPDFRSEVREGVELTSGSAVMVNSQLAIGDLKQETTVSAAVPNK